MADDKNIITKDKIRKLANSFSNTPANDLDKKSEEQIKFQFIEPLFEALGWQKEDIEKEQRVLKGRADYILKIGNQEVMVIEAKRTNVSLDEEEGRQAVSYAYHRKIKFAVLTNFKQIRVYHALSNIKSINKNLLTDGKGYLVLNSYDFVNEFDRLRILSRESFEKGEINKLLSAKDEKVSKPIDESILLDLLQYRDWLSKDLKKLRMNLSDDSIDEIVQILIDRLIFMRSVEDRGLEDKDLLLKLIKDVEQGRTEKVLWGLLKDTFKTFDKTYNSKLFAEGLLEKGGFFDEDTLKKVISGLYYGTKDNRERYMFDEIPGDLLGNIYEQYLGTVLRGSDKRVKLEEGTGKRKKMGIFYTPSYIVDYIVKNTVGEYIRNKTIDEILDTRIVDPACGSGSFLIRAFREVCDVVEKKLANGERSGKWLMFKNYKGRLSLGQKMDILRNCIYGVDLDEKAVELAQLNLLLRLLEDETKETRKQLPTLKDNIKCGNSLIDDLSVSDKAFSWRAQFPNVFAQGGFDVVVGNPPYVLIASDAEKTYLQNTYKYSSGKPDLYRYFIERSHQIIKNDGRFGFIVPNTILTIPASRELRRYLLKEGGLIQIANFWGRVFSEASVNNVILFTQKGLDSKKIEVTEDKSESPNEMTLRDSIKEKKSIDKKSWLDNEQFQFQLSASYQINNIIEKIKNDASNLGSIAVYSLGMQVYHNTMHTQKQIDERVYHSTTKKDNTFWQESGGRNIQRYLFNEKMKEYVSYGEWCYNKPAWEFCASPRILIREIPNKTLVCAYSDTTHIPNKAVIIVLPKNVDINYLLGILNSSLMGFYIHAIGEKSAQRLFPRISLTTVRNLPIKVAQEPLQKPLIQLVSKMLALQKKCRAGNIAGREKELLEQQIKQVDFEIDQEVYKIYEITEEEKRVVEAN